MPRNWLRTLSDRLSAKPARKQIRRTRKPGGAITQPLEARVLLAAPTLVGSTSFTIVENVGVNSVVLNPFTSSSTSHPYTDPITGATYSNPSNGQLVGVLNATPNDGGQVIINMDEPPGSQPNVATPFDVRYNAVTRQGEIYINNFEQIDFEQNPTFTVTVRVTDSGTNGTPETNDVTYTVNLINQNDIPYITRLGSPHGPRPVQEFTIDENSVAGTVLTGISGVNAGGVLDSFGAVRHEPNNTAWVDQLTPHDPLNNNFTDLTGVSDNVPYSVINNLPQLGDNTKNTSLRYQILRNSTSTTTQGGAGNEIQLLTRPFDLDIGQYVLYYASDLPMQTLTQGNPNTLTSEVQQIDFGKPPVEGFYTLTFNDMSNPQISQTTRHLSYTATAAEVQAELQALTNLGANNVKVEALVKVAQTTAGGVGVNEVQTLTLTSVPKNGFFYLTFNGKQTGPIAANADGAAVQAALESLSTIGAGNISVTGGNGGPYTATFQGALAQQNVTSIGNVGGYTVTFQGALSASNQNQLVMTSYTGAINNRQLNDLFNPSNTNSIQTSVAATIQAQLAALPTIGGAGAGGTITVAPVASVSNATDGGTVSTIGFNGTVVTQTNGVMGMTSEVQRITVNATGVGNFRITLPGTGTTGNISSLATAAAVQTALEGLVGVGNVTVTGNPNGPYTATFVNTLGDVNQMEVNEVQQISMTSFTTGNAQFSFNGVLSSITSSFGSAAAIQTALNSIPALNGNVSVTGGGGTYQVTFLNGLSGVNVNLLTVVQGRTLNLTSPANATTLRLRVSNSLGEVFTSEDVISTFGYANASQVTAANIQTVLQRMPNIGTGNVTVTGAPGGPFSIGISGALGIADVWVADGFQMTFGGTLGNLNVNQIGVVNQSDLFQISNEVPTLGRLTVSPIADAFMMGTRGDGLNGLASGYEFFRQFFGAQVTTTTQGGPATNEVQVIRVTPTSPGVFRLTFNGQTTNAISTGASAAQVRTELENLLNISVGDVAVTGLPGGPYTVTFGGSLANTDVSQLEIVGDLVTDQVPVLIRAFDRSFIDPLTNSNTDGGFASQVSLTTDEYVVVTINDVSEAPPVVQDETFTISESAPNLSVVGKINDNVPGPLPFFPNVTVATTTPPGVATNEVQTITAITTPPAAPGTFALRFGGQTTPRLSYNATAAEVENALRALSAIGPTGVTVTRSAIVNQTSWTVTFTGPLAATDVPLIEVVNGVTDLETVQVFRYTIVGGNTNNAFAVNQTTGEITVNNSAALDYETGPSYRLLVRVDDLNPFSPPNQAVLSTITAVDINLTDFNEATTIPDNQQLNVEEGSPVGTQVGKVSAFDLDRDATLKYSITNGNTLDGMGNPTFAIDQNTGVITVNSNLLLDSVTHPFFDLEIRVIDDHIPLNSSATNVIRINVVDVNQSPPIVNDVTFTIPENRANGFLVGTIQGITTEVNQTITYSFIGPSGPFSLNSATGQLRVTNPPGVDFESQNSYTLIVKAADSGTPSLFDTAIVTIFITDQNEQVDIAPQTLSVVENSPSGTVVGTVASSDPDDNDGIVQGRSYSIVAGNSNNAFAINAASGEITVLNPAALNFESLASYTLVIQVNDVGLGPQTADVDIVTINVVNANDPPVIQDQTMPPLDEHRQAGTVVGTVTSSDQDAGQTRTYQIIGGNPTNVFGDAFVINSATGQITINNPGLVDFTASPSFALTVQVTDNGIPALSDTGIITINLVDRNPPIINDQAFNVNEGAPNGTVVSVDGGMMPVSLQLPGSGTSPSNYFIISGNTNNAFTIDGLGRLVVNNSAAINFSANPTFTLHIRVVDSSMPQLEDNAVVTVNVQDINLPPVASDVTFSIDENPAIGAVVGTVMATDPDASDTLTYAIISGNAGGQFSINGSTGQITIANPVGIDFETNPSFALVVRVTDNGTMPSALFDDANVTINVNNLNEPPIVTNATFTLAENSPNATVVGTVTAADPDPGQTVTFSIVSGNTGGAFAINPVTGQITVANSAALDFETSPSFNLIVGATDNAGVPLTGNGVVTINLTNVNEPGLILPQTFNISENRPIGYVVGTVVANDPDPGQTLTYSITGGNGAGIFAIDANTGVLTVVSPTLNFEAMSQFSLTVQVKDNGAPMQMASAAITINILDLNEAPTILPPTSFTISENRPAGYVVGQLNAQDQDQGQTLTWAITGGNPNNIFALSSSGLLTIASPTLSFETTPVVNLQVTVTDNGTPTQSRTGTVTINVNDLNEAPVFTGPGTFNIAENRPIGTVVGTVGAVDPDAGQTLTYAITNGNINGTFAINASTGQLTVAVGSLNYEATPVFNLTVTATDNGNPTQTRSRVVTINILDLNEQPNILPPTTFSINENSPSGTVVGSITAVDQDQGQTLTYSITGGNTNNAFAINSATGQIRVLTQAALDFETTPVFNLQVTVVDNGSPQQFRTANVTINVLDRNENVPVIAPQTFTIAENSALNTVVGTVVASDADPGQTLTYAIISGNTNNAFKINASTGQIQVNNPAALNFETIKSFALIVRVTDNGTPVFSAQNTVTVNLTNVNEFPIVNDQTFTVPENTVNGNAVATITATDPDGDPNLTYAIIGGNTLGAFSVDPNSGVVRVANTAALDYEARTSITFQLRVTDSGNPALTDTANVTFLISNQNDPPKIAPQTFTIGRNNPNGSLIGTVIASDQDAGQTLTYSITSGNTGGAFSISSANGQLFLANRNALIGRSQIPIVVTVRDNGAGNFQASATITVKIVAGTTPAPTKTASSSMSTSSATPASQTVTTSSTTSSTTVKKTTDTEATSASFSLDSGSSSLIAKVTAPVVKAEE